MPAKRGNRSGRRRRHRKQHGSGIKEVLSGVNNFLKKNKVISRVANAVGTVLPPGYSSVANGIGAAAGALGYGRGGRHQSGVNFD